jgi:hypothetical protein
MNIYNRQKNITTRCSCLSIRGLLQTTDNLISDGPHLFDISREFLLRTANPSPIRAKFAEGKKDFTNPKV